MALRWATQSQLQFLIEHEPGIFAKGGLSPSFILDCLAQNEAIFDIEKTEYLLEFSPGPMASTALGVCLRCWNNIDALTWLFKKYPDTQSYILDEGVPILYEMMSQWHQVKELRDLVTEYPVKNVPRYHNAVMVLRLFLAHIEALGDGQQIQNLRDAIDSNFSEYPHPYFRKAVDALLVEFLPSE